MHDLFLIDVTDATGNAYTGVENLSARMMPKDLLIEKPTEVKNLLLSTRNNLGTINYFLGGMINEVPEDETSVHPAVRNSAWNLLSIDSDTTLKIRDFVPNDVTGVCYNHHYRLEPDWHNACWGAHHSKLSELKSLYDPEARLNCWHCVGWQGGDPFAESPTSGCQSQSFGSFVLIGIIVASLI
mmetsp:Transcript_335/g.446  ORF Transcript_335/g.446 Transcript_335/m.446 type:complete len:184 (+) Transcript_335:516-1067(+)